MPEVELVRAVAAESAFEVLLLAVGRFPQAGPEQDGPPVRVGLRLGSLDGLRVFRATGSARQLRRTLRSFLRFLRNARNQSRDADDRRDDDEDDVLIPMHGEHGGKIVKALKS